MGVVMHIMDDKLSMIGGRHSPSCRFKRLELFCLFRRKAFGVKGPLIQSKNPHLCCKSGDDNKIIVCMVMLMVATVAQQKYKIRCSSRFLFSFLFFFLRKSPFANNW